MIGEEDGLPGIGEEEDGLLGIGEEEDGLPGINTEDYGFPWMTMLVDTKENPFLKACPRGWQKFNQGVVKITAFFQGVWQERWAFSLAIFGGVSCF